MLKGDIFDSDDFYEQKQSEQHLVSDCLIENFT